MPRPGVRRLTVAVLLAAGGTASCRRTATLHPRPTIEEAVVANVVDVNDPVVASQLLQGFYQVEQNAWRWVARRFQVRLQTPLSAADRGALFRLRFSLPDVVTQRLPKVTVRATVGGSPGEALPAVSYTTAGAHTYEQPVTPAALPGNTATITVEVDPYLPSGTLDGRELSVIVNRLELSAR